MRASALCAVIAAGCTEDPGGLPPPNDFSLLLDHSVAADLWPAPPDEAVLPPDLSVPPDLTPPLPPDMTFVCPAGLTVCGGACANLQADNGNCGACGMVCPPGTACGGGACLVTCAAPLIVCGGACVDPRFDPMNCGVCGVACARPNAIVACQGGACALLGCGRPFGDCNGSAIDGCEVDTSTDVKHCGGCGRACSANNVAAPLCAGGQCTGACSPGFGDCDKDKLSNGCETALLSDVKSCGGCGVACSANHIAKPGCAGGACNGACDAGFADCDANKALNGCEIDIGSDPANCGACGRACPGVCSGGVCTVTLQPDAAAGKDTDYGSVYHLGGNANGEYIAYGGWGDFYYGFLQFDVTNLPASASTAKAELMLSTKGYFAPNDPGLQLYRVTAAWDEALLTNANHPAAVLVQPFGPVQNGWNTVDITALYKGWKDGTFPNFGVELFPTLNNQTNGGFASSDHNDPTIRPKLVITLK